MNNLLSNYKLFLSQFDAKLECFFNKYSEYIYCKKGCCYCCQEGDYPISELELQYLMQGYINLDNSKKLSIQENITNIKKGKQCPFLLNNECSIYDYRPIICRVHGLAYLLENNTVKIPYCVNNKLNFHKLYKNKEFYGEPINTNLDTSAVLKDFNYGEIRNLYDWLIK